MKLLFDANLSPRLVELLEDLFPDSEHIYNVHGEKASDRQIWQYAIEHSMAIVTKDADFDAMSAIAIKPAKVIWIRRGNCPTKIIEEIIEEIIRVNTSTILAMSEPESTLSVLVLL